MQRRLQRNPDNGYDVGHAEGRRRGQDGDLMVVMMMFKMLVLMLEIVDGFTSDLR